MNVYFAILARTGEFYVGITKNAIKRRIAGHFHAAKRGEQTAFARAIRKHGREAFTFYVVASGLSLAEAVAEEIRWIANLQPRYNSTKGGPGSVGHKWTQHQRDMRQRPVIVMNENLVFESVTTAAAYAGVQSSLVTVLCKSGRSSGAHGWRFMYVDQERPVESKPYNSRKGKPSPWATGHMPGLRLAQAANRKRVVREDGEVFASITEAGRSVGTGAREVSAVIYGGYRCKGFRFWFEGSEPAPARPRRDKMNSEAVKVIRFLAGTRGRREIAAAYGISAGNVRDIVVRRSWAHVA